MQYGTSGLFVHRSCYCYRHNPAIVVSDSSQPLTTDAAVVFPYSLLGSILLADKLLQQSGWSQDGHCNAMHRNMKSKEDSHQSQEDSHESQTHSHESQAHRVLCQEHRGTSSRSRASPPCWLDRFTSSNITWEERLMPGHNFNLSLP